MALVPRRVIQRLIEDEVSEQMLRGDFQANDIIHVDVKDDQLVFTKSGCAGRQRRIKHELPGNSFALGASYFLSNGGQTAGKGLAEQGRRERKDRLLENYQGSSLNPTL